MKKLMSLLLIAILVISATSMCFAATTLGPQSPIPIEVTVPAIGTSSGGTGGSSGTGVDLSITEKVTIASTAGSPVLQFGDIVVTNHANTGQLKIAKVEVTAANGWTIKPDSESYFKNLKSNTKEVSIVADGVHDFSEGPYILGETKLVKPDDGEATITFSGHIGTFTKAETYTVAHAVLTIEAY